MIRRGKAFHDRRCGPFSFLPRSARALALAVLVCAAVPPVAGVLSIHADFADAGVLAHLSLVQGFAGLIAVGALLVFERPRSPSPIAYGRQLRARFLELQAAFDADDRRRTGEGKEKEDDRVPSDP